MPMFKKQKKEETREYKEQCEEASKNAPDIDEVEVKTETNNKTNKPQENKEQPTLLDIVITMPEVEYKAQVLALLSEIVQRLREEQGGENADK